MDQEKKSCICRGHNYLCRKSKGIDKKIAGTNKQLYNKVAGYKINKHKSITFLYTSNEQVEFKIKNTISLTLAPKC